MPQTMKKLVPFLECDCSDVRKRICVRARYERRANIPSLNFSQVTPLSVKPAIG